MDKISRLVSFSVFFTIGCSPDLRLPPSASVECYSIDECPLDLVCNLEINRCVSSSGAPPTAPALTLQSRSPNSTQRVTRQLDFELLLSDANSDTLALTIEFQLSGGTTWQAADVSELGGVDLTAVEAPPAGRTLQLRWDAVSDLANAGLSTHTGNIVAAGDSDDQVASATALDHTDTTVSLKVSAVDPAFGQGEPVTYNSIAVGNSPPDVSVDNAALVGFISGEVALPLNLADEDFDPIDLEVEVKPAAAGPDAWQPATVIYGSTVGVSSLSASQSVLVWASRDSTGGIGNTTQEVELRVRARDWPDGDQHLGAWSTSSSFLVSNQNPPRVLDLQARRAWSSVGASPVAITFRLADEESDDADLRVEYAGDVGTPWLAAREFPMPRSEGRIGLATSPLASGAGGVLHTFVWDPTGVRLATPSITRIRVIATDGLNPDWSSTEITLAGSIGPPGEAPHDGLFGPISSQGPDNQGMWTIVPGDFNGDGNTDVAGARSFHGEVFVMLGNSDGTFASPTTIAAGITDTENTQILAGYFDADTNLDLAVVSNNFSTDPDAVFVLLGNGAGGFGVATQHDAANEQYGGCLADVNGDEITDIVATGFRSGSVAVLIGIGDGSFLAASEYAVGAYPRGVRAGDFDENGETDLAVGMNTGVAVLLADGAGGFSAAVVYSLGAAVSDLVTHDLDGDDITDLVGSISSTGKLKVLWGQGSAGVGDGTFVEGATSKVVAGAENVTPVDFNGDGVLDLFVTSQAAAQGALALGNGIGGVGDGTFAEPLLLDAGEDPNSAFLEDLDGDQVLDVVIGDRLSEGPGIGTLKVFRGRRVSSGVGAGTLSPQHASDVETASGRIAVADFDSDGILDVAAGSLASSDVTVFSGRGRGGVGDGSFIQGASADFAADDILARDINSDGILDLIGTDGNRLRVALGNGAIGLGDGTFAASSSVDLPGRGRWIAPGDFDGNGIVDLAIARHDVTNPAVDILLGGGTDGVGDGTFQWHDELLTDRSPTIAAGDFDTDGRVDLVVVDGFPDPAEVKTYLGDGSGGFTLQAERHSVAGADHVDVADFNDDGILDVIVVHYSLSRFTTFFGDGVGGVGDGTFTPGPFVQTHADHANPEHVAMADIDGDSIVDVIVPNVSENVVSVFHGDGTDGVGAGSWSSPAVHFAAPTGPRWIQPADVNQDCMVDFVVANQGSSNLAVFFGQQERMLERWDRSLSASTSMEGKTLQFFGSGFDDSGMTDRFADPVAPAQIALAPARVGLGTTVTDVLSSLRQSGVTGPLVALTGAWQAVGDIRLVNRLAPDGSMRLRAEPRFGPLDTGTGLRAGFDIDNSDFSQQRGIIVDLPFKAAYTGADAAAATDVKAFCRVVSLERAASSTSDPLYRYLPTRAGDDESHLVVERPVWVELNRDTSGSFPDGTGPRFWVDEANEVVRTISPVLGMCQAFLVP